MTRMATNYEVLVSKFNNFRAYIREHAKSPDMKVFDSYTDKQFLGFSCILLKFKEEGKLGELAGKTCHDMQIGMEHMDKVLRYYICFCDYLMLLTPSDCPELVKAISA